MIRFRYALPLSLLLAGCAGGDPAGPDPIERLPRPLTLTEAEIVRSGNDFGLRLFREVYARETASDNVFLSPLSAHMALGMTLNGATGETFEAMRATLGFGGVQEDAINASFRELTAMLLGLDPGVDIAIANSLWYRDTFAVLPSFIDVLRTEYDAEVAALDFSSPAAPRTINAWVREATRNRIDELVGDIRPDVVAYLINAVWFKAPWTEKFDPRQTRDGPFHRADGTDVTVPFMNRKGTFAVQSNEYFEGVDLPYGGGAWRMSVLVPQRDVGVDGLVTALTPDRWAGWVGGFHEVDGFLLSLPRFKLEYDTHLVEALGAMGMGIAFSEGLASFERIAPPPPDLYISDVRQKTFIEVNEEGTEAAAATSVEMGVVSLGPQLLVDRPFVIAIRERFSGTLLFIGAIGDPS